MITRLQAAQTILPLTPQVAPAVTTATPKPPKIALQVGDQLTMSATSTRTPLQKHVDFFDRDGNRSITVGETFEGLRALGMGRVTAALGSVFINAGLGMKTGSSWTSPLTVNTNNIAAGKHDSDTDIYDTHGQLNPAKFEAMFTQFDLDNDQELSQAEFTTMRTHNKETTAGGIAAKAEFDLLVKLAGTEKEVAGKTTKTMTKEQLKDFYNGNLFYHLAGEAIPQQ